MYESYLNLTIFTYILGKRFVDKDKQNLVNTLREKKRKERKNIDIINDMISQKHKDREKIKLSSTILNLHIK